MPHFKLIKKKKQVAENPANDLKNGLSVLAQSLGVNTPLPVFTSIRRKEKPSLTINTQLPANWTPPSSPPDFKTSHGEDPRALVQALELPLSPPQTARRPTYTPPNTPTAPELPRRKSSFTSFFLTPRQRKLEDIRLGKLPAVVSDSEISPPTSRVSTSTEDGEIQDPSSSTTYNRRSRVKRSASE
jgi:hypothetical protein